MKLFKNDLFVSMMLFVLGLLVFSHGLYVHGFEFRDDEIFYYMSTNEMVDSGQYMSPTYFGQDRFQKPILFYWLIVASYKVFGVNWFAARLVAAVFGALTLLVTWWMAKSLFDRRTATLSSLILMTTPLFLRHAKNAVPDMPLNFFIVAAIYFFLRFSQNPSNRLSLLFFISCGLGFMIKGFAAIIVPFLLVVVFSFLMKRASLIKDIKFGRGLLVMLAIILPWFLYMIHIHGSDYLDYMWGHETMGRLMYVEQGHVALEKLKVFLAHLLFYFQIFLQQFMPWSLFGLLGIFYAFRKVTSTQERMPYVFLLVWIFIVYLFFSFMYFSISHYILVLTTPVAILTSRIFLSPLLESSRLDRCTHFVRLYGPLAFFVLMCGGYFFVITFIARASNTYLMLLSVFFISAFIFMIRSRSVYVRSIILAGFLIGVAYQSPYLAQLGLTTHVSLRKFAQSIEPPDNKPFAVGVASHDLHDKEFQVYVPSVKVEKIANDNEEYNVYTMRRFFAKNQRVYCLITEKDYNRYLNNILANFRVIEEEYVLRKRLNLDVGFVKALLQMDRERVYEYFMENVVLVIREENV